MGRQKQATVSSPFHRCVRRLRWVCAVGALILIIYATGGLTWLLHRGVERSLAARHYESADSLLTWVQRLGCANAETSFWLARLRRKELRIADVGPLLAKAEDAGFDRERLHREALLLRAQTGEIGPIVDALNQLISDPGSDGPEVCEAYVNGALIAGDTTVALTILNAWKAEYPQDPQPHYAHGRLLEYRQLPAEAEREYLLAISKDRCHWPARYALGRLWLERSRVDEALAQFNEASKMRDPAAPRYQAARCLRTLSRLDEAHAILTDLVSHSDEETRRSFNRVGEPELGHPIALELGGLELERQKPAEALRWLNVVLGSEPRNLEARAGRAAALRSLGRIDESAADLEAVRQTRAAMDEVDRLVDQINREPQLPHVSKRCRIGELYLRHEIARKAEFWLREALQRDPEYQPAHTLLAEYYGDLAVRSPEYAALAEEHRRASQKSGDSAQEGAP